METSHALDRMLTRVEASRVCIENLEAWSPECFGEIVAQKNLARCVDVGHFWLQKRDPLPHLEEYIARTRVVHLHGVNMRDHQSLTHQPRGDVESVLNLLAHFDFAGVLTLEVFGLDDFLSSLRVVTEWENGSR